MNALTAPVEFSREEGCLIQQRESLHDSLQGRAMCTSPFFRCCAFCLNRAAILVARRGILGHRPRGDSFMSSVVNKQSTDFSACFETYRKATGGLMEAVHEHASDEAKAVYESLMATHEKVGAINNVIRAAKRKERMDNLAKWMPRENDEALVEICPGNDEPRMQYGRVLM